jgi:membrane protein implicated in regulation of membrane protease activity
VESDTSAVGCVGVVTVATRGADGSGEVLISIRGGSEAYLAWSDEPLPKGRAVLVVRARGTRTVEVVPWDDRVTPLPKTS